MVTALFKSDVPPTAVNGMLVSMKVRDVGTFYYDVGNWLNAFYPLGQCQGP